MLDSARRVQSPVNGLLGHGRGGELRSLGCLASLRERQKMAVQVSEQGARHFSVGRTGRAALGIRLGIMFWRGEGTCSVGRLRQGRCTRTVTTRGHRRKRAVSAGSVRTQSGETLYGM